MAILNDMTPPAPSRPARRLLIGGAIVIGLLVLVFVGIGVAKRALSSIGFGAPAPATITHEMVVERLRDVSKLVATEMTLRDVVIYEQSRFGIAKKALLVVTGRVSAGIDLERGADVRIDSAARRIVITLPPAQILSVDILNVTTYDERSGIFNPFKPEDRDAIQRRTRAQLMVSARSSGILEHADESAARVLRDLLSRDGFTVEIRRPVVQVKPEG